MKALEMQRTRTKFKIKGVLAEMAKLAEYHKELDRVFKLLIKKEKGERNRCRLLNETVFMLMDLKSKAKIIFNHFDVTAVSFKLKDSLPYFFNREIHKLKTIKAENDFYYIHCFLSKHLDGVAYITLLI